MVPQVNNVGPKNGQIDVPQHKLAVIAQVATLVTDPYERKSSVQLAAFLKASNKHANKQASDISPRHSISEGTMEHICREGE